MSDYYDRTGAPISLEHWGKRLRDPAYKIIDQTEHDGVLVSTVWLGLDHSFTGGEPPLIFETMIFRHLPESWADDACWRWATEAQARAGHAEICSATFRSSATPAVRHEQEDRHDDQGDDDDADNANGHATSIT